jgi:hypothetical protein
MDSRRGGPDDVNTWFQGFQAALKERIFFGEFLFEQNLN